MMQNALMRSQDAARLVRLSYRVACVITKCAAALHQCTVSTGVMSSISCAGKWSHFSWEQGRPAFVVSTRARCPCSQARVLPQM
jgi:hypothetical protein